LLKKADDQEEEDEKEAAKVFALMEEKFGGELNIQSALMTCQVMSYVILSNWSTYQ
jgi:hypothetical protein